MKQKILLFVFFLLLFTPLILIAKNKITLLNNKKTEEIPNTDVETQIITKPVPLPYEKVLLSQMPNEEKVGQIFIWGVEGTLNLTPRIGNSFKHINLVESFLCKEIYQMKIN